MIELKHVSKTFDSGTAGGVDALKDVSLLLPYLLALTASRVVCLPPYRPMGST